MVASASGRFARMPKRALISAEVSKIDGQGSVQSMISAAVRHGFSRPAAISAARHRVLGVTVRRGGPDDRAAVAPGDPEEALADRRGAVIARPQLAVLGHVAERLPGHAELAKDLAAPLRARPAAGEQRAPLCEFLDVLQDDDARPLPGRQGLHKREPGPGESADVAIAGLAALRLRVVLAVGREPEQPDRTAAAEPDRVDRDDVLLGMMRLWMVHPVHRERDRVVVDRDVGRAAEGLLDPGRGPAAAGEAVDDELAHAAAPNMTRDAGWTRPNTAAA